MDKCIFVCAGEINNLKPLQDLILQNNFCIAVDGGFDYCLKIGIQPNISIGDFDSATSSIDQISYMSQKVMLLPEDKDLTDLEAAFDYAFKCNYKDFYIYGGLEGKREDLNLSNIFIAVKYLKKGCRINFISKDSINCIRLLKRNEIISIISETEDIVSIISLSNKSNISISNLKYEYEGDLKAYSSLAVSNRTIPNKEGTVFCNSGIIVVYLPLSDIKKE